MKLLLFALLIFACVCKPSFDLLDLKKQPKRKLMIFKPLEMALSKMPKLMTMKPYSIPNLNGGTIDIMLPKIKNPIVIDEFPTNQYFDAHSQNEIPGPG